MIRISYPLHNGSISTDQFNSIDELKRTLDNLNKLEENCNLYAPTESGVLRQNRQSKISAIVDILKDIKD